MLRKNVKRKRDATKTKREESTRSIQTTTDEKRRTKGGVRGGWDKDRGWMWEMWMAVETRQKRRLGGWRGRRHDGPSPRRRILNDERSRDVDFVLLQPLLHLPEMFLSSNDDGRRPELWLGESWVSLDDLSQSDSISNRAAFPSHPPYSRARYPRKA